MKFKVFVVHVVQDVARDKSSRARFVELDLKLLQPAIALPVVMRARVNVVLPARHFPKLVPNLVSALRRFNCDYFPHVIFLTSSSALFA